MRGLELLDHNEPGFWETYGYHMYGGPMERTAVRGRLTWQVAAVTSVIRETDSVRTIGLEVPDWPGHRAGQHLDVRLTAEDGYTAERSYSIASTDGEPVAITVERLDDGEVSPYLTGEPRAGDQLELRGPIGRWFVWDASDGGPLLLVAGGSGVVPLRVILRHRQRNGSDVPVRLLYSSRTLADVIYHRELDQYRDGAQVIYTLTRSQPRAGLATQAGWTPRCWRRPPGRPASIRSRSSAGPPASSRQWPRGWSHSATRRPGQDRTVRRDVMVTLDGSWRRRAGQILPSALTMCCGQGRAMLGSAARYEEVNRDNDRAGVLHRVQEPGVHSHAVGCADREVP